MFRVVRVQYTATPEFVPQNKANIAKVMADLREINNPGLKYATFLDADGVSFMHFAMFENEEATNVLNSLESFKHFQAELKANVPGVAPKTEKMTLVASGYEIFV